MIGLRVTDGTTTVSLSQAHAETVHYVPLTPETERVESKAQAVDGGEAPISAWRNVTEPAEVAWVTGNDDALADINGLIRLFGQARDYQRSGLGSRVYVEFSPDGSATWYRSEVLDGSVILNEAAVGWQWTGRLIQAQVIWLRRFFWEGPEAQIPLTNGHGTNNVAGLTVYNSDQPEFLNILGEVERAHHDNWVQIAAADVAGDLVTPPRIEITNTYNNSSRAGTVFVAHNVSSSPATFPHILEGEDAADGTEAPAAANSDGAYKSWAAAAGVETKTADWTLASALLNLCAGNYFQVLCRFAQDPPAGSWVRMKVLVGLTTLWEGPKVLLDSTGTLQELGAVQLPPYLMNAASVYPLHLALYVTNAAGATIHIDYAQLSPLNGWRKLQPKGYNLGYGARLIDDMIGGQIYTDTWDVAGAVGNYIAFGQPILLDPGRVQRLYFLHRNDTNGAPIDRTFTVKLFYRPRRLTL